VYRAKARLITPGSEAHAELIDSAGPASNRIMGDFDGIHLRRLSECCVDKDESTQVE
jgi:hypothetical protein